jgi:hypothetical protein
MLVVAGHELALAGLRVLFLSCFSTPRPVDRVLHVSEAASRHEETPASALFQQNAAISLLTAMVVLGLKAHLGVLVGCTVYWIGTLRRHTEAG